MCSVVQHNGISINSRFAAHPRAAVVICVARCIQYTLLRLNIPPPPAAVLYSRYLQSNIRVTSSCIRYSTSLTITSIILQPRVHHGGRIQSDCRHTTRAFAGMASSIYPRGACQGCRQDRGMILQYSATLATCR